MKKVNVGLVRLLQFVVFVLFTFMVLAYFGAMVLLPLSLVVMLVKIMGIVGLHGFISALVAVPVIGYLFMIAYRTQGLCPLVVDTGVELVKTGQTKIEAFNQIVNALPQD